ncbi:muconate/chloromuconate family cycloisomerase [Amorphus sp. 3PC139-8]|uniref:muconate/chloromuconate family cycloisomerase n=1 Tax=Amorphus sp. 3PC139-8 TaxID=2735676 RepID=UPI00345C901F
MNATDATAAARTMTPATFDQDLQIRDIQSVILDVPTRRRHKLANTEISHQNYVLVSLRLENGVIGYGEASTLGGPRWAEESVESIRSVIETYLAPALVGRSALAFEANAKAMSAAAQRNFAAKAALEAAMLDAAGKTLDLPATALLGGEVRTRFPVIWALASGDAAQEIEEAQAKIAAGEFNRFKIKIGFDEPARDVARLQAVRAGIGDATLVVDINQGWSEATCLRWLPALEELGVDLVEQPLPAGQLEAMSRIARRTRLPLMLDEAVFTPEEALRGVTAAAGSVLSLKLVKAGGPFATRRIAGIASAGGLELYGGCLLESSIGAAAHLACFATLPTLEWGTEHFGPKILVDDVALESLTFRDYEVHLPDGPGLGVEPDPERVRAFSRKN